jgi:hypothetical protein
MTDEERYPPFCTEMAPSAQSVIDAQNRVSCGVGINYLGAFLADWPELG